MLYRNIIQLTGEKNVRIHTYYTLKLIEVKDENLITYYVHW